MMRSMFSAVSGLRVHQTRMDVIANNIANVNTVGFKSSRVTFAEIFSQTLQGGSRANEMTGRAGTNPQQIGLGVTVGSIDISMIGGVPQRTDRALDLMIEGDGFFIVSDNSGVFFTRAGAMDFDVDGFLHINGMRVQGWQSVIGPNGLPTIQQGPVSDIRIAPHQRYIHPTPTSMIEFEGNLNAQVRPIVESSFSFFDTVGTRYVADITFTYDVAANEWTFVINPSVQIGNDSANRIDLDFTPATGVIEFDNFGNMITMPPITLMTVAPGAGADMIPPAEFGDPNGTPPNQIALDFTFLTGFSNDNTPVKGISLNGNAPGTLAGVSVGTDGNIFARYSNGDTRTIAQIAVARFRNPAGLEKVGNNLFVTTPNSGEFNGIGEDVTAAGGNIRGGVLEMSNVDLASEFTEMITTQRGFQANSRVISTSDEMLMELVNLRR